MEVSSANKRIAKNTLLLYIRMAIVLVVSLYTTRVVLHSIGVEDYGIYNVVCGFVAMFSFLNSTLSSSINRFYNYELGKQNPSGVTSVYNNALRIQVTLAIILFIVVELIGVWYINTKMVIPVDRLIVANWIFHFATISMLFTILQTPYIAAILAYERMDYYAVVSIVDVLLKLGISILVRFVLFDKLWLYGFLIMLIAVINFFLYYIYSKIKFDSITFQRYIDKTKFRQMLSFSSWSLLNPLAYTGRSQGCNIVLNYYFGPIVNAAYAITNQVASAIDSLSMSISVASRPQIIQSYSSAEFERSKSLLFATSKMMFLLISILVVPLSFNIGHVLNLWLGETVPENTSIFCVWMLYVKLIDTLNPSVTNVIMATGKVRSYMIISSLCIISVIPISIFAFKNNENPTLLFVCMFICTLINQCLSVFILKKVFDKVSLKEYFLNIVVRCILFIALIALPCLVVRLLLSGLISIIVDYFIVFSVGLVCAYYVALNQSERLLIKRLILHKSK